MYIQANSEGKKIIPAENSWRMILSNDNIASIVEDNIEVMTESANLQFFVASSKEECAAEADRLGLSEKFNELTKSKRLQE